MFVSAGAGVGETGFGVGSGVVVTTGSLGAGAGAAAALLAAFAFTADAVFAVSLDVFLTAATRVDAAGFVRAADFFAGAAFLAVSAFLATVFLALVTFADGFFTAIDRASAPSRLSGFSGRSLHTRAAIIQTQHRAYSRVLRAPRARKNLGFASQRACQPGCIHIN
nr:hypothetical protein [Gammaproteobacteria bacterium]